HRHRRGASLDRARGGVQGRRNGGHEALGAGQALRLRGGGARHGSRDPDPRRLRLHPGLSGPEGLPRRPALHGGRRHERDSEARHREAAPLRRRMSSAAAAASEDLARGVLAQSPRAIGRAISEVERDSPAVPELLRRLFPETGRARIVGVTGPPGAGKSTLVQRLAQAYRKQGRRVGIVAVDPSSPFTGGAILVDRIRMAEIYTDPGVFIRSMATRGALGGLARATSDAVDVLDASGFDVVLIETVGVGQDEVDIVQAAETVAVVLVPGLGDDIQAIKAGILEIGDVFIVNKADREGADRTAAELAMMLDLSPLEGWRPPIVRTVAPRGEGIAEAVSALAAHGEHL